MDIPLGPHEIALLAAICGSDVQKQAEHAARLLRKALNRQPDKDLLREFETWWSYYPRKIAVGAARTAYCRARGKTDANTLLNGLAHYNASLRGSEAKFIAHASTWLNQERWADQNEPPKGMQINPLQITRADPNYGYRSQVQHFVRTGHWCFRGTPPTDPTCLVPREVLREFEVVFRQKGLEIPALL